MNTFKKSSGDFIIKKGEMLFQRVGPIKAVKQKNNIRSPESRGLWAFPFPIFDWFFVPSSWSWGGEYKKEFRVIDEKIERKMVKRLKGLKRAYKEGNTDIRNLERKWEIDDIEDSLESGKIPDYNYKMITKHPVLRKREFYWGGPVYAHFAPKGMGINEGCEWYLYDNAISYLEQLRKHIISLMPDDFGGYYRCVANGIKDSKKNMGLAADHLEVFIPYKG